MLSLKMIKKRKARTRNISVLWVIRISLEIGVPPTMIFMWLLEAEVRDQDIYKYFFCLVNNRDRSKTND